jgi:hypothetical protein
MPDFPLRPEHPDFWAMSEIVLDFDHKAAADPEGAFEQVMSEAGIDMGSVIYMGMQRAMRVLGVDTQAKIIEQHELLMKMTTLYAEALVVGTHIKERRNARDV